MGTTHKAIVQFQTVRARDTITRPANATAYADGDVIANADNSHLVFQNVVDLGAATRSGSIPTARITSSANQTQKPELELWLFQSEITASADNAAFAPTDAELADLVGIIDFPASSWRSGNSGAGAAGNSVCEATNLGLVFKLDGNTLHGVLVVRDPGTPYTPVSGETFTVDLLITKD